MRFAVALGIGLVSAVACAAAFPPTAWYGLAWIGYAPLLVVLRRARTGARAAVLAWAWLTLFAWLVGAWLPRAVSVYFHQPAVVGGLFFLGVSGLMAAVEYAAFAIGYRALARRRSAAVMPLLAAAAWVVADAGRVAFFGGCPWGLPGYSQLPSPTVVQIADMTGVFGVTFVVVAVNAALAELWLAVAARRRLGPALAGCGVGGLVVGAVLAYGVARLGTLDGGGPSTRVAVVQGNLDVGSQWRAEDYGRNLEAYLRLTHEVLVASGAQLVVWPESAMTFFLDREPLYRNAIAHVTQRHGAQLVAGGPRAVGEDPETFYNSVFVLLPDGTIAGRYDKVHLLPFAEYFPAHGIDLLQRRFGRVRQFAPGEPTAPPDTSAGRAGVLVCNEAMFGSVARERVRAGAQLLTTLANDSWVDDAQFSAMALDMMRLRAVETRRWMLRASTSGPSAVVDPAGRVVAATAMGSQAALVGDVQARNDLTPYTRFGDLLPWLCGLAVAGALLARRAPDPSDSA